MRDFLKTMLVLMIGLLVVLLIYPFIHESGHSIAAALIGGKITEFRIFPLPYIICDTVNLSEIEIAAIGFGGMILSFLVALLLNFKCFFPWYAVMLLNAMNLLSYMVSLIGLVVFFHGTPLENDDITIILTAYPSGWWIFLTLLIIMSAATVWRIENSKPLQRFFDFFNIT